MEAEVGPPGSVDRERNSVCVHDLRDAGDVGHAADVAWLHEHHGLRFGVRPERLLDARDRNARCEAGLSIDVGADPDRNQPRQHEPEEERLVEGPSDDHLVAGATNRERDRHVAVR